jgi:hypothetical protein
MSSSVKKWFKSPEFKAIRQWQINQGRMLDRVRELTKECKNDYDVVLHYNTEKSWFGGQCYFCCELHYACKKGKRKEVFEEDEKGDINGK